MGTDGGQVPHLVEVDTDSVKLESVVAMVPSAVPSL